MLKYKGYYGTIDFNLEENLLYGSLLGFEKTVTYESNSLKGLKIAFEKSVDEYFNTCEEMQIEPKQIFNRVFTVETSSKIYEKLAVIAASKKIGLYKLVNNTLEKLIDKEKQLLK